MEDTKTVINLDTVIRGLQKMTGKKVNNFPMT